MKSRLPLSVLAAALVAAGLPAPAAPVAKPNVVLFLVDDMGWMDCGVQGSQYYETPNIDAFAKRSMRFTNAYAQPLCSPTRASILSGQYTARHGTTTASGHRPPQPEGHAFRPESAPPNKPMLLPESKNYLDPAQITLAEVLKSAGYRTAHLGKWHLGLTPPHWPEQQGFDVTFHCAPDPGPPGAYFSPYGVIPDGKPNGKQRVGNITDGPAGEYIVDRLADEAVKFIDGSKGGPFFLNLWCYGVHGPWGHKEAYTKYFARKKDPTGRQGNPIMASMLKSVDECFGRILAELDAQGVADNTIIIFYSDNGGNTHSNVPGTAKTDRAEESKSDQLADWRKWAGDQPPTMNTPLRDGKGTLYEGGTRVPLMWAWAGRIRPGTLSDAIVGPIDLYPTVLDLTGIPKPPQQVIDGVSYAKVLKSEGGLERKAYFNYHPHAGEHGAGGVWVRSGDYKLLRWFGNPGSHELYNLKDDLGETTDLSGKMPEKAQELEALIDGFLKDTGALYPLPNPAYKPAVNAAAARRAADPLQGFVPKGSKATVADGVMRVEADGNRPFLGCARVHAKGPLVLQLRARTAAGGPGRVQWRTSDQETFPQTGQVVDFAFPASTDWQDVRVEVPVSGEMVQFRIYVPATQAPVEFQTVRFVSGKDGGKAVHAWDFAAKGR